MKKLIVLALVLGLVSSSFAAVYTMDISTTGAWTNPDGTPTPLAPAGWSFSNFDLNGGYVEVLGFQDLGGGVWGNVLNIGATDALGNGVIDLDDATLGIDVQQEIISMDIRYKLIGALPDDAGARFGYGFSYGSIFTNSRFGILDAQWGAPGVQSGEIWMNNYNYDWGFYTADDEYEFYNKEPIMDSLMKGEWSTANITIDGLAPGDGEVRITINGVTVVYDDFGQVFTEVPGGDLTDPATLLRALPRLTVNGTMHISDLVITTTPEPATIALLGMGALALIRKRR